MFFSRTSAPLSTELSVFPGCHPSCSMNGARGFTYHQVKTRVRLSQTAARMGGRGNISRAPLTTVLIDRREKKAFAYIIYRLSSAIININQWKQIQLTRFTKFLKHTVSYARFLNNMLNFHFRKNKIDQFKNQKSNCVSSSS